MWHQLLFLSLTVTSGLGAGCDEDACNIGIAVGVGAATTCAAVGGGVCAFTLGAGCVIAAGCGVAGAVAGAGKEACSLCEEDKSHYKGLTAEQEQMLKEVDQNILRLGNQMKEVRLEIVKEVNLGALQASYHDDLQHFDLFLRSFEELDRDASGTIVKNRKVEHFKEAVNDLFRGARQTYNNIHKMLVGDRSLNQKSIFEIDSAFCSTKDYYLYMFKQLLEFDSIAKAMGGRSIDPVQIEKFKKMLIEIQQKHINTCGCPPTHTPERMSNLQLLVSQPTPHTSGKTV